MVTKCSCPFIGFRIHAMQCNWNRLVWKLWITRINVYTRTPHAVARSLCGCDWQVWRFLATYSCGRRKAWATSDIHAGPRTPAAWRYDGMAFVKLRARSPTIGMESLVPCRCSSTTSSSDGSVQRPFAPWLPLRPPPTSSNSQIAWRTRVQPARAEGCRSA